MAYSDFDLGAAQDRLGLKLVEVVDLFADIPSAEPGEFYLRTLAEWVPPGTGDEHRQWAFRTNHLPDLNGSTETIRKRLSIFPGVDFNVDRERGLNGVCDYLVCRSSGQYIITCPVVTVVEAKKEDIRGGLGQCAAGMVGAQVFNARRGDESALLVHGVVTSGNIWRFLRLDGTTLLIDQSEYYLREVGRIIGILLAVSVGTSAPAATV